MDAFNGIGAGTWPPAQAPGRSSTWTYRRGDDTLAITINSTDILVDGQLTEVTEDLGVWFSRKHVELNDDDWHLIGHHTAFDPPP
jgi:hypothetical protein